ncbi:MAG: GNAT family N-acetyltransferase [Thermocrispum sp.]
MQEPDQNHPAVTVRPLGDPVAAEAVRLLDETVAGRIQFRLGRRLDVLGLPGFGAWTAGQLAGVAIWSGAPNADGLAELAVLAVAEGHRGAGIGGRLVEEVITAAGCSALWLVTTNDNLDALRLYQRRGFRLSALHRMAVDAARDAKPSIPLTGNYGIPLHDELVLRHELARS